jgi:chromosome segregation protein
MWKPNAHARAAGIAGKRERRHGAAHRAGGEGIAGTGLRLDALDQEIAAHQKNVDALEEQIAQARGRMQEINAQRESLQARVREREQAIEAGRQVILRLLGEASTLKNQLAQIEEYLAGIERETARSQREEQIAAAEIERLETARKQLSETLAQRQLELEAVTGERRRTEEDLGERRQCAVELRREIDGLKNEVSQIRARKESLEQVLAHRTTPPNR